MLVKDHWVTQALRVIQKRHPDTYVFKGGTSLTKALRCVDRFSEDVDLLIARFAELLFHHDAGQAGVSGGAHRVRASRHSPG